MVATAAASCIEKLDALAARRLISSRCVCGLERYCAESRSRSRCGDAYRCADRTLERAVILGREKQPVAPKIDREVIESRCTGQLRCDPCHTSTASALAAARCRDRAAAAALGGRAEQAGRVRNPLLQLRSDFFGATCNARLSSPFF